MRMKFYEDGTEVLIGDTIEYYGPEDRMIVCKVFDTIIPNLKEANAWRQPQGCTFVENERGLTLWEYFDAEVKFLSRKQSGDDADELYASINE